MNATVGSIFCAMCMSACAPSQPSTAMVPYTEVVMKVDVENMVSLHQLELEICHREKQLTDVRNSEDLLSLTTFIKNQTAYIQSLTHNHTESVGDLNETIQALTDRLTIAESDQKALRDMNRLLTTLLAIFWIFAMLYGAKKLCKWINKVVTPTIAAWGARVEASWNSVGVWFMCTGCYLRDSCINIANTIVWVGSCIEAAFYAIARGFVWVGCGIKAVFFAIARGFSWVGCKLMTAFVKASKLLARGVQALAGLLSRMVMHLIFPLLIMTPLVLFKDHIPGLENIGYPTTWVDAVIFSIKGFELSSLLEIALKAWVKHMEEAEEGPA